MKLSMTPNFVFVFVWSRISRAVLMTAMGEDTPLVTDGNEKGSSISLWSILLDVITWVCLSLEENILSFDGDDDQGMLNFLETFVIYQNHVAFLLCYADMMN